ncbi:hypothetical protein GCM10011585_12650 [Edaphobacter dinghuensis]|uniref:Uncharacterized protein n=1 Tax=Edaphobacter dinghuensis TaxID=1560005 RepID=A0A917H9Q6_9BACT|nr:hypothetical protein GCM10011585_12650 [Edaphobacter dinghuensis]
MEYQAECPKCQVTYSDEVLWKVCPVCVTELKQISVRRCDPVPKTTAWTDPRVYTVDEVAKMTGFHRNTVTKLFENEPGVIILERPTTMNKQRYRTIRIPHFVYERVVLRKLSVR